MSEKKINKPNASILIESIRSIGYSFESALADIVDNSISSNASIINIDLDFNTKPIITILDNGCGMDSTELFDAMKYGSRNPKETRLDNDLGRFGLGMKSASMSQCRKLTVISKKNNQLAGFCWDIDVIELSNEWEILELNQTEIGLLPRVSDLRLYETGTLVVWENFDRIEAHAKTLNKTISNLLVLSIKYMGLIYHRFISDGLKIYVNQNLVDYIDPFLSNHKTTSRKKTQIIEIDGHKINIKPYILPHKKYLSENDIIRVGGLENLKNEQGFYIYRNRRLIIWGTWFRMTSIEELNKLARIQVDIPNSLDYIWSIDVKKSTASLPDKIKKQLAERVHESIEGSNNIYKKRAVKEDTNIVQIWDRCKDRDDNISYVININSPLIKSSLKDLNEVDYQKVKKVLKIISDSFPYDQAYYDHAKGKINNVRIDNDSIWDQINEVYKYLSLSIIDKQEIVKLLRKTQPFCEYIEIIDKFENEVIHNES